MSQKRFGRLDDEVRTSRQRRVSGSKLGVDDHRSRSRSSAISRGSSKSSAAPHPPGVAGVGEKLANFDKIIKSFVVSFECKATGTTLKEVDGQLLVGGEGGCDKWRYRDETLINVASGLALTVESTSRGPATGRLLRMVPRDKSFVTQKFNVSTSGVLRTRDGGIVTVQTPERGSRGDQSGPISVVVTEDPGVKETPTQIFYIQVHIPIDQPFPDDTAVPKRMKFRSESPKPEEVPTPRRDGVVSASSRRKSSPRRAGSKRRQGESATRRVSKSSPGFGTEGAVGGNESGAVPADVVANAGDRPGGKRALAAAGPDLEAALTEKKATKKKKSEEGEEGEREEMEEEKERGDGQENARKGKEKSPNQSEQQMTDDEADGVDEKDEEKRRKRREKKKRQKEKKRSRESLENASGPTGEKKEGEEEDKGNLLVAPRQSASASSIASSIVSTATTTTFSKPDVPVSPEAAAAFDAVVRRNTFHLQSRRNKKFWKGRVDGELEAVDEPDGGSKWTFLPDGALVHVSTGACLVTDENTFLKLAPLNLPVDEPGIEERRWVPTAEGIVRSASNPEVVLTRKSAPSFEGGAAKAVKKETFLAERLYGSNKSLKERYSQNFKFFVEEVDIKPTERHLLSMLPRIKFLASIPPDPVQPLLIKPAAAASAAPAAAVEMETDVIDLAPATLSPNTLALAKTVSATSMSSIASSSPSITLKDRRAARENFAATLASAEFEIQSRRTKFGLCDSDGRLVFVDPFIASPATWVYRDSCLQLVSASSSPPLVLTLSADSENNAERELKLEPFHPARHLLQAWHVDDAGRITSRAQRELALTTSRRASKTQRTQGVHAEILEKRDAKKKQDQTFTFLVGLKQGEEDPSVDKVFPSRMKFVRQKSASNSSLNSLMEDDLVSMGMEPMSMETAPAFEESASAIVEVEPPIAMDQSTPTAKPAPPSASNQAPPITKPTPPTEKPAAPVEKPATPVVKPPIAMETKSAINMKATPSVAMETAPPDEESAPSVPMDVAICNVKESLDDEESWQETEAFGAPNVDRVAMAAPPGGPKDQERRRRRRNSPSESSASSKTSSKLSVAESTELLVKFEKMISTHRFSLQWKKTKGFLTQDGTELTCRDIEGAAKESHQWRYSDGTITNCLRGEPLTSTKDGRLVIGAPKGRSAGTKWILTTSGLLVVKDEKRRVGGGVRVVVEDGADVRLITAKEEEKRAREKGAGRWFYVHVFLDREEPLPGATEYPSKMKFVYEQTPLQHPLLEIVKPSSFRQLERLVNETRGELAAANDEAFEPEVATSGFLERRDSGIHELLRDASAGTVALATSTSADDLDHGMEEETDVEEEEAEVFRAPAADSILVYDDDHVGAAPKKTACSTGAPSLAKGAENGTLEDAIDPPSASSSTTSIVSTNVLLIFEKLIHRYPFMMEARRSKFVLTQIGEEVAFVPRSVGAKDKWFYRRKILENVHTGDVLTLAWRVEGLEVVAEPRVDGNIYQNWFLDAKGSMSPESMSHLRMTVRKRSSKAAGFLKIVLEEPRTKAAAAERQDQSFSMLLHVDERENLPESVKQLSRVFFVRDSAVAASLQNRHSSTQFSQSAAAAAAETLPAGAVEATIANRYFQIGCKRKNFVLTSAEGGRVVGRQPKAENSALWTFKNEQFLRASDNHAMTLCKNIYGEEIIICEPIRDTDDQKWSVSEKGTISSAIRPEFLLSYDVRGILTLWHRKEKPAPGSHHSFVFKVWVDDNEVPLHMENLPCLQFIHSNMLNMEVFPTPETSMADRVPQISQHTFISSVSSESAIKELESIKKMSMGQFDRITYKKEMANLNNAITELGQADTQAEVGKWLMTQCHMEQELDELETRAFLEQSAKMEISTDNQGCQSSPPTTKRMKQKVSAHTISAECSEARVEKLPNIPSTSLMSKTAFTDKHSSYAIPPINQMDRVILKKYPSQINTPIIDTQRDVIIEDIEEMKMFKEIVSVGDGNSDMEEAIVEAAPTVVWNTTVGPELNGDNPVEDPYNAALSECSSSTSVASATAVKIFEKMVHRFPFQLQARRTKFVLGQVGECAQFVERSESTEQSRRDSRSSLSINIPACDQWIYRNHFIENIYTGDVLTVEKKIDFLIQVKPKMQNNSMQKWFIDSKGLVIPESMIHLYMTVQCRNSKRDKFINIQLKEKKEKGSKERQDQTFTLIFHVNEEEVLPDTAKNIPHMSIIYDSSIPSTLLGSCASFTSMASDATTITISSHILQKDSPKALIKAVLANRPFQIICKRKNFILCSKNTEACCQPPTSEKSGLWLFKDEKLINIEDGLALTLIERNGQNFLSLQPELILQEQKWELSEKGVISSNKNKNLILSYNTNGEVIVWNKKTKISFGSHHTFTFKTWMDDCEVFPDVESIQCLKLIYKNDLNAEVFNAASTNVAWAPHLEVEDVFMSTFCDETDVPISESTNKLSLTKMDSLNQSYSISEDGYYYDTDEWNKAQTAVKNKKECITNIFTEHSGNMPYMEKNEFQSLPSSVALSKTFATNEISGYIKQTLLQNNIPYKNQQLKPSIAFNEKVSTEIIPQILSSDKVIPKSIPNEKNPSPRKRKNDENHERTEALVNNNHQSVIKIANIDTKALDEERMPIKKKSDRNIENIEKLKDSNEFSTVVKVQDIAAEKIQSQIKMEDEARFENTEILQNPNQLTVFKTNMDNLCEERTCSPIRQSDTVLDKSEIFMDPNHLSVVSMTMTNILPTERSLSPTQVKNDANLEGTDKFLSPKNSSVVQNDHSLPVERSFSPTKINSDINIEKTDIFLDSNYSSRIPKSNYNHVPEEKNISSTKIENELKFELSETIENQNSLSVIKGTKSNISLQEKNLSSITRKNHSNLEIIEAFQNPNHLVVPNKINSNQRKSHAKSETTCFQNENLEENYGLSNEKSEDINIDVLSISDENFTMTSITGTSIKSKESHVTLPTFGESEEFVNTFVNGDDFIYPDLKDSKPHLFVANKMADLTGFAPDNRGERSTEMVISYNSCKKQTECIELIRMKENGLVPENMKEFQMAAVSKNYGRLYSLSEFRNSFPFILSNITSGLAMMPAHALAQNMVEEETEKIQLDLDKITEESHINENVFDRTKHGLKIFIGNLAPDQLQPDENGVVSEASGSIFEKSENQTVPLIREKLDSMLVNESFEQISSQQKSEFRKIDNQISSIITETNIILDNEIIEEVNTEQEVIFTKTENHTMATVTEQTSEMMNGVAEKISLKKNNMFITSENQAVCKITEGVNLLQNQLLSEKTCKPTKTSDDHNESLFCVSEPILQKASLLSMNSDNVVSSKASNIAEDPILVENEHSMQKILIESQVSVPKLETESEVSLVSSAVETEKIIPCHKGGIKRKASFAKADASLYESAPVLTTAITDVKVHFSHSPNFAKLKTGFIPTSNFVATTQISPPTTNVLTSYSQPVKKFNTAEIHEEHTMTDIVIETMVRPIFEQIGRAIQSDTVEIPEDQICQEFTSTSVTSLESQTNIYSEAAKKIRREMADRTLVASSQAQNHLTQSEDVTEALAKIDASLINLKKMVSPEENSGISEVKETVQETTKIMEMPERFEMYTHPRYGLRLNWNENGKNIRGKRNLKICVNEVNQGEWTEILTRTVAQNSSYIIIPKDDLVPGTNYSVEMSSTECNNILVCRSLTLPPDPPDDATSMSSSRGNSHHIRWSHPRGRHDSYRLTFRAADSDDDNREPLGSWDVGGGETKFIVTKETVKMLTRGLERGAGDDGGTSTSAVAGESLNASATRRRPRKSQNLVAELRTIVEKESMGTDRGGEVVSDAVELTLKLTRCGEEVKAKTADSWKWTPTSVLGAFGVLAGAAALYYSVVKDDSIPPTPTPPTSRVLLKVPMSISNVGSKIQPK